MTSVSPDIIAQHLREVADDVILPRFQNLQAHEIDTKTGPNDLVTIADREAEVQLTRIFKDILPGSYVVGEEAVSAGQAAIDALATEPGYVWVVDPVDGTGNFSRGEPIFGLMAALVYKGQTVQGWIYDIPGQRMGIAETGAGTTLNGKKQRIDTKEPDISFSNLKAYIATGFVPKQIRPLIVPKLESFEKANALNCCAHEYLNLLEGARDFSFYKRMKPWDHLPGLLLYQEAGGYSRSWAGERHSPANDQTGIINAPDETLWQRLHSFLLDPEIQKLVQPQIS